MRSKWINELEGLENYTGYKIYEDGKVFAFKSINGKGKIDEKYKRKCNFIMHDGYWRIGLRTKGYNKKFMTIHRLVALAFIPNPENKETINHKNGTKTDNRVENLEWMTVQENIKHACENGLRGQSHFIKGHHLSDGSKSSFAKLNEKQVTEIKQLLKEKKLKQHQIAELYNINSRTISAINTGLTWKYVK